MTEPNETLADIFLTTVFNVAVYVIAFGWPFAVVIWSRRRQCSRIGHKWRTAPHGLYTSCTRCDGIRMDDS